MTPKNRDADPTKPHEVDAMAHPVAFAASSWLGEEANDIDDDVHRKEQIYSSIERCYRSGDREYT